MNRKLSGWIKKGTVSDAPRLRFCSTKTPKETSGRASEKLALTPSAVTSSDGGSENPSSGMSFLSSSTNDEHPGKDDLVDLDVDVGFGGAVGKELELGKADEQKGL